MHLIRIGMNGQGQCGTLGNPGNLRGVAYWCIICTILCVV